METYASKQTGAVLIFVMFLIAAMTVLILEFVSFAQVEWISTRTFADDMQAMEAARTGISIGLLYLRDDALRDAEREEPFDALTERWATVRRLADINGARVTLRIEDENRKLNLYDLVQGRPSAQARSTRRRFLLLLDALSLRYPDLINPKELVDRLDEYVYDIRKTPLLTKDELTLVDRFDGPVYYGRRPPPDADAQEAMESQYFEGLRNHVSLFKDSGSAKINVNTATPEVLMSLSRSVTPDMAEAIVRESISREFTSVEEMKERLDFMEMELPSGRTLYDDISSSLGVQSSFFTIESTATRRKGSVTLRALVQRSGGRITILSIQARPEKQYFTREEVEEAIADNPEFYEALYPKESVQ